MTSAFILGPFGNYFVPLMIGAGVSPSAIEALTFWLVPLAGPSCSRRSPGTASPPADRLPPLADQPRRHGRVHLRVHPDRDLADAVGITC